MDALGIQMALFGGFDWGARTANIIAAIWPERCKGMVSTNGYLIGAPDHRVMPLPSEALQRYWYQYYFTTDHAPSG